MKTDVKTIQEAFDVAYHKIVGILPIEKRSKLSVKLADIILKSKNDDKMPSRLAKKFVHEWRQGPLLGEEGLAALLEAAVLLESEKTIDFLEQELKLVDLAKAVKQLSAKGEK